MLDKPKGPKHARRQRGMRIRLVVHGRCRAREVENDLGVRVQRLANVADLEVKPRIPASILEVAKVAGHQVIEADDLEAFREEAIDEMRPDEASRPCDQDGAAC
jgi:hypothetical protein